MNYEPNTKKHIALSVPGTDMTIPVTMICGGVPGNTITISAGVHSREYIGIEAVIRLAQELVPEMVQGTVLLLHCCNYAGFISCSSDVVPLDGKNLNVRFPEMGMVHKRSGWQLFWKQKSFGIPTIWWICIPAASARH